MIGTSGIVLTGTYDDALGLGEGLVQIFLRHVTGLQCSISDLDGIVPVYFAVRDERFQTLRLVAGDGISGVIREEIDYSVGGFMQSERYLRLGNVQRLGEGNQGAAKGNIFYISDYKPRPR